MSIEETYEGMWSSDPDLLKSLLDAGETIIAKDSERKLVRLFVEDEEYLVDSENQINNTKMRFSGYRFLIPPCPLVLDEAYNWIDICSFEARKRLKELIDDGDLVITREDMRGGTANPSLSWSSGGPFPDGTYNIHNNRCVPNSEKWDEILERVYGAASPYRLSFLSPRPLVLEPKPLVWEFQEESENNVANFRHDQWPWHFYISEDGSYWAIYFEHDPLKSGSSNDVESAKAAIHEWWVNHFKSMIEAI